MRKISFIALVSMMPLFLGGCLIGEDGESASKSSPSPSPVAKFIPPPKPLVSPSPFAGTLAAKQTDKEKPIPGLIKSLPANVQLQRSAKGRNDPFAVIPTVPLLVPPSPTSATATPTDNRPVPPVPPLTQPRNNQEPPRSPQPRTPVAIRQTTPNRLTTPNRPTTPNKPTVQARRNPSSPRTQPSPKSNTPLSKPPAIGLLPPPVPNPKITPLLPKLPEPTQAKGIEVTGVVEVAGVPNAIIKAPDEPTTRSVREGERLSNGQVLVKRIEMNQGPSPVVILEQFGIEVARQVGDKATTGKAGTSNPNPDATTEPPPPPPPPDTESAPPQA